MASVTLTLAGQCSGGGHLTLALTGDVTGEKVYDQGKLDRIIDEVDREQLTAAIIRLAKVGRTWQEVRTLLQSGITVAI